MDEKKLGILNKVIRLSQQDTEFGDALRKKLGAVSPTDVAVVGDQRLDEIYELCIEKIVHKQAEEFYKDFPIQSIVPQLIEDFVRMESFRRKDAFGDFCLALYEQIENMTNKICESVDLDRITAKMWGYPAYVLDDGKSEPAIDKRMDKSTYKIANLIFPGTDSKQNLSNAYVKSRKALQSQFAFDKIRIIVYFYGYKAVMRSSDYNGYKETTALLNDVYQCRNTNHRGNTLNEWEKQTLDRILPQRSVYYFKFMGVLAQYIDMIKTGTTVILNIRKYSDTLIEKPIKDGPHVNVLGKIDLTQYKTNSKRK